MSKFIDRLKQLTEGSPQPMGFHAIGRKPPKLKIQLIASLSRETAENPNEDLKEADAGLVRLPGAASPETIKSLCTATDMPWGVWTEGNGATDLNPLMEAGADFFIFPPGAMLACLLNEDAGKLIEVEPSIGDMSLRAVNGMPLDGVFVSPSSQSGRGPGGEVTWMDLMAFHRIAALVSKPVLVSVPLAVTSKELQALWEAGVDGVIVAVPNPQAADGLKALRQMIDKLEYPKAPKQERGMAFAPRVQTGAGNEEREEEEEEE